MKNKGQELRFRDPESLIRRIRPVGRFQIQLQKLEFQKILQYLWFSLLFYSFFIEKMLEQERNLIGKKQSRAESTAEKRYC